MQKTWLAVASVMAVVIGLAFTGVVQAQQTAPAAAKAPEQISLPAPVQGAPGSLEYVLANRRSVRVFSPKPLTQQQIGQLFWAAQGITHDQTKRTAPSAGAVYALEIYVVTKDGLFHYLPKGHAMVRLSNQDLHQVLFKASNQKDMLEAPAVFVIAGVVDRMMKRYPAKAEMFVNLEVGHAAENLLLESTALGLVSVPAGGFTPADVQQGLSLPADEKPIYLIPVGYGK